MKIPKLRWIIALLLFLATSINYADRLALSVVSSDLRKEFAMTEQDYSYVVTAFLIAYAIMYAGSGYVVDRLGTRAGFALFIFTWSLAAMLHGFVQGKWSLVGARFLLGLGQPGNWPAAAKAIAEWFPAGQRALAVGIFNAGSSAGSALAPPVVAYLTLAYGWRSAFVFIGSIGLVWMVVWLLLYEPPHKNRFLSREEYLEIKDHVRPPDETAPAAASSVNWRKVMGMRECYTLIIARFFTDPVIYFIIFWLPEYSAQGAALRPRHGRQIRLGAVHLRRHRLHARRMALRLVDGQRLDASERSKIHHADRRRLFAGRDPRAACARSLDGHRRHLLRHLRSWVLGLESASAAHRPVSRTGDGHRFRLLRYGRRRRRHFG